MGGFQLFCVNILGLLCRRQWDAARSRYSGMDQAEYMKGAVGQV